MKESPHITEEVIATISNFIKTYNLKWFPGKNNSGVYFLTKEICKILPLHYRSVTRSWKKYIAKNKLIGFPVVPRIKSLTREEINWLKITHPSLKINKQATNLNICNWSLLYAWFISTNFPQGRKKHLPNFFLAEKLIQNELVLMSSYTNKPLRQEVSVPNILVTDPKVKTRRFDLILEDDNVVNIYELKSKVLSIEDIYLTLGSKGYLDLAAFHYQKPINFYFVAYEFSQEALNVLKCFADNIFFISLKYFIINLLNQSYQIHNFDKWYVQKVFSEYRIYQQLF